MEDNPILEQIQDLSLETGLDVTDDNQSTTYKQTHAVDSTVPISSKEHSANFQCKVGETIHLKVMIGNGPFQWKFNGETLGTTSRELTKEEATMTDSGEYECNISDGNIIYIYHVRVYDFMFQDSFLGIRTTVAESGTVGDFAIAKGLKDEKRKDDSGETSRSITVHSDGGSLTQYSMTEKPRGIAVILAIEEFDKMRKLHGIKHDISRCEETFKSLHFDVRVCKKTKATEILKYLKSIANIDHSKYDCFILYVSSHGGKGFICGSDFNTQKEGRVVVDQEVDKNNKRELANGYLLFDTLLATFLSFNQCSSLNEKPKLFFFDCCRTDHNEISKETNASPIRGFRNNDEKNKFFADIFIGYATLSGNIAGMNDSGSVYTEVLTECMRNLAPRESLLDVMTEVNRRMQKQYNQISHQENTLCAKIVMEHLKNEEEEL